MQHLQHRAGGDLRMSLSRQRLSNHHRTVHTHLSHALHRQLAGLFGIAGPLSALSSGLPAGCRCCFERDRGDTQQRQGHGCRCHYDDFNHDTFNSRACRDSDSDYWGGSEDLSSALDDQCCDLTARHSADSTQSSTVQMTVVYDHWTKYMLGTLEWLALWGCIRILFCRRMNDCMRYEDIPLYEYV